MKKILLVMVVLLGLFLPTKIYAMEDSFREAEYIPDAYIKKFRGSSGKYEQMRVFRRNSDNRPVYCLEIWEPISSNKTLTGYDSNQKSIINISENTWKRIMLLAYYGYGYQNHTDIKWYAVTQFLIWRTLITNTDTTVYFTDTLNGNMVDKYIDEINEINSFVYNHEKTPSFATETDIYYNQMVNLIDRNNVLTNYDINNVSNGLIINRSSDSSISVVTTRLGRTSVTFTKNDSIYSNNPTVYVDDSGQDLLLAGSFPMISKTIYFIVGKTNLTVNKLDNDTNTNNPTGDATFDETTFELYDIKHNYLATTKVNNSGQAIFNNIGYGTYYLKEIKSGNGYLLDTNEKQVIINKYVNTVNITNQVIKNKIKIRKYLKDSLGNLTLEKAKFTILDSNMNEVTSFETNDGYYELELPYGSYTLRQINGEENYKFIDDISISVNENAKIQELELYNEELQVPIKIINTDSESMLPILEDGASFSIRNTDTGEIITLTTDSNGETNIINLVPGNYEIYQNSSINPYLVNDEKIILEVNENNFSYDNYVYNIEIPNDKEKAKIEISKFIKYYLNDELVDIKSDNDINISIYAKEDIYTKDGVLVYKKDEEVDKVSMDKLISKELVYGKYYINNPVNSEIIDITLDKVTTKKIEILDEVYRYTSVDIINDVPNTYINESFDNYFYLILILIGSLLVYIGKKYEDK